jgi:hypothetical protein
VQQFVQQIEQPISGRLVFVVPSLAHSELRVSAQWKVDLLLPAASMAGLPALEVFSNVRHSVHRRRAAAPLVLLPRAARARDVPPDLGNIAPWFACVGNGTDLPLFSEILMPPDLPAALCMHDEQQPQSKVLERRIGFLHSRLGVSPRQDASEEAVRSTSSVEVSCLF